MTLRILKIFLIIALLLISVQFTGCSSRAYNIILKEPVKPGLPGVDSLIYARSDSITTRLFVHYSQQQRAIELIDVAGSDVIVADSLWFLINQIKMPVFPDSVDRNSKKGLFFLEQIRADSLNRSLIKLMSYVMLNDAIESFQNVEEIDPFNLDTKSLLADAYFGRGEKKFSQADLNKAAQTLESLIAKNKGQHDLYDRLGDVYWQLKDWQSAFENYQTGYRVLLATAFLNSGSQAAPDTAVNAARDTVDSKLIFHYYFKLAAAKSSLYDASTALQLLHQAYNFVQTKNDSDKIKTTIDWILWDDGNIAASELRDSIIVKEYALKFEEAYKGYLGLLDNLKTEKAKKWIQNRLAQIEFWNFDEREKGAQRLLKLISTISVDPETEMPVDSTDGLYFHECGEMHYELAISLIKKSDYNKAKDAFATSASIPWANRGRCFMELARLSLHNHEAVLQYVEKALASDYHFKKEEMIILLNLKLRVLRQMGPRYQDEARKLLDQIRNLQSSGA